MDSVGDEKICGYKISYDYYSATPVHYLSLLLKYFMPSELVWDQALKQMIECDSFLNANYGEKQSKQEEIVYAGSTSEGLAIPDYLKESSIPVKSDIDKLLLCTNTYYYKLPFEHNKYSSGQMLRIENSPDLPPNYCLLAPTHEYKRANETIGKSVGFQYFSNMLHKAGIVERWSAVHKYASHINSGQEIIEDISIHGPAATIIHPLSIERDEVPVFSFPGWPMAAREWVTRKRPSNWPSKAAIDEIILGGFYLAGVGRHGEATSEFEWRYSFNKAEKILAHSLSKCQRQVFVYLKLFRKFFLQQPALFASYWLKTFFFWFCEKVPESVFGRKNLGHVMLYIFDELIHIFSTGRLSNYFISSVNMLQMVSREHLASVLKNLRFIKANLIECLIEIDKKIIFFNLARGPSHKLEILFSECFQAINENPNDLSEFRECASKGLKKLIGFYIWNLQELDKIESSVVNDIVKQFDRNLKIELLREALKDLRQFCECKKSADQVDVRHMLEHTNDMEFIAQILVLLKVNGEQDNLTPVKSQLLGSLKQIIDDNTEKHESENAQTNILSGIREHVESFPAERVGNLENETLYRIQSIYATVVKGKKLKQLQNAIKTQVSLNECQTM